MDREQKILVVDNEPISRSLVSSILSSEGYATEEAEDGHEALTKLQEHPFDLILVDEETSPLDGFPLLDQIARSEQATRVILVTASEEALEDARARKLDVDDHLAKPLRVRELVRRVSRALNGKNRSEGGVVSSVKPVDESQPPDLEELEEDEFPDLVSISPCMKEVRRVIEKVASSDVDILLLGESGSGKEVVAKTVHGMSARRKKPFVVVNCVALPEGLLESELFGHKKGAFTGADVSKDGYFQVANGGTLFLDEVGDMSPNFQTKLLRVLEEGECNPVGDTRTRQVNVRIISATNRDLVKAVQDGTFREDLFYRLNVVSFSLPPLRERPEDIAILSHYFLHQLQNGSSRPPVRYIHPEVMEAFLAYPWPGNVRELRNVIESAMTFAEIDTISLDTLPPIFLRRHIELGKESGKRFNGKATAGYLPSSFLDGKKRAVARYEADVLKTALEAVGGNITRAAQRLEIHRSLVHRLLKKHGIRAKDFR